MSDDFQHVLEENRCLKKEIQMIRYQNEKLQQELSDTRFDFQELLDKNTEINHVYNQIQKKSQLQVAQHNKDIATLTSQIEELKVLINQKQRDLQDFQIKMIPNLDQDMIMVKLIAQMQGPYQQAIQKRERENTRLKQKLSSLQRKANLSQLNSANKQRQLKRELSETIAFYQSQNQKLLKQLNMVLNKKEIKSYDRQVFKNQRKELQQLRFTINLQEQNEMDLKKQLAQVKMDKQKLLVQICQLNQKKALELHLSSDNAEVRALREEKKRIQDDFYRKNDEVERLEKKIRNLQKETKINQEELKRNNSNNMEKWQHEKELLVEELRKEKDENRRAQNLKEHKEDDNDRISQTLKNVERELQLKKNECEKLKETIADLQKHNRELQIAKKRKISLTKDIIDNPGKRGEETNKKENNNRLSNEDKDKYADLEKINAKLKEKLDLANKKIVELLKQKANCNPQGKVQDPNSSFSRERAFSNIEIPLKPNKDILLEYRDASLTPLVPPTIFTRQSRR